MNEDCVRAPVERRVRRNKQGEQMNTWKPASEPPQGEKGKWTREVVAVTNYGNVFSLAYFNGEEGGCWQRPERFNNGEQVAWWIEKPSA